MVTLQPSDQDQKEDQKPDSFSRKRSAISIVIWFLLFLAFTLEILSHLGAIPGSWSDILPLISILLVVVQIELDWLLSERHPLGWVWRCFLLEPLTFLFYSFFQPAKFQQEVKSKTLWKHTSLMLRLGLPIFSISYLLGLGVHIFYRFASTGEFLSSTENIGGFLVVTAESTLLGIIFGVTLSTVRRTPAGIAFAIAGGIVGDVPVGISGGTFLLAASFATFGIIVPVGLGIVGFFACFAFLPWREYTTRGLKIGLSTGLALLIAGFTVTFLIGRFGITATPGTWETITQDVVLGVLLGLVLSDWRFILIGIFLSIFGFLTGDIVTGIYSGPAFIASYAIGHYRLPFYPVSVLAWLRVYRSSPKPPKSSQIFTDLKHPSLYWDEHVYLPLPGLKSSVRSILDRILDQNHEQHDEEALKKALEAIQLIAKKRPQHIRAMQPDLVEIILGKLATYESIYDIAQAFKSLDEILPEEVGLINSQCVEQLTPLNEASKKAAHALTLRHSEWQSRCEALQEIIGSLKIVTSHTASNKDDLSQRLQAIVNKWRGIAGREQLEIILYKLERCEQILDMAQPSEMLEEFLSPKVDLINPQWVKPLTSLNEASKRAAQYRNLAESEWQGRQQALQEMRRHLRTITPYTLPRNGNLAQRLQQVLDKWLVVAERRQLEVMLGDLKGRQCLDTIAQASSLLEEFLSIELEQINRRWVKSLTSLNETSKKAAHFLHLSKSEKQHRHEALQKMIAHLTTINLNEFATNKTRREYLSTIIVNWRTAAEHEQAKIP